MSRKRRLTLSVLIIAAAIALLGAVRWLDTPRGVCFRYFGGVLPLTSAGEVLRDTHGGFLEDGVRLTRFSLGARSASALERAHQAGWDELPLPEWLAKLYGGDGGTLPAAGAWQCRGTGDSLSQDGTPHNFVLAVIDEQAGTFYLMEYDS